MNREQDIIDRAQQACRYVAKHHQSASRDDTEFDQGYSAGYRDAADRCEQAIIEHLKRHGLLPS